MWTMIFLIGGNVFSQNGARCALLFGLKEEWESAFDASAEVSREKANLFNERFFKEDDEPFLEGDGVTRPEGNLVLRVKPFWEEEG